MMKAPRLRKLLLWPLLSTCLVMPTVCTAQAYPGKSVRIIVPAAPSGGLDIMARVVGQPLAVMWGHPVVVDNRPGAGVMLGTEIASRATPDGYTMLMVNANLAPNAILHDKLPVVKGDENVPYGRVIIGASLLNRAGAKNLGFLTDPAAIEDRR